MISGLLAKAARGASPDESMTVPVYCSSGSFCSTEAADCPYFFRSSRCNSKATRGRIWNSRWQPSRTAFKTLHVNFQKIDSACRISELSEIVV